MRRAHVVGAGLAGLSAAMTLAERGYAVTLSEVARAAGGRCRSYHDAQTGLTIDNGNHLVLSGNAAIARYLGRIGASDRLAGPRQAAYPFVDLRNGERWTLRPNDGRVPWWITRADRRVPGTRTTDYLGLAQLRDAPADATIADMIATRGAVWEKMVAPLMVSALNTPPERASARLAGAIFRETLAKGGRACRPLVATPDLSAAFIDPAIAWLERHGAAIRFRRRLRAIHTARLRAEVLLFGDEDEPIGRDEPVILAVPAWIAAQLMPGLTTPDRHYAIVNGHFAMSPLAGAPRITGVVGGTAEWVFTHADRISTTTSAIDPANDEPRETLAERLWADVRATLGIAGPLPPWQLVRERRATFAATPDQDARRPDTVTPLTNLFLAGDWVQTGLPATIEGALRSGEAAAAAAMRMGRQ